MTDLLVRLREKASAKMRKTGPRCTVCILPSPLLEALRQLRSEGISYTALVEALKDEGHVVRAGTLGDHFRAHEQG